MAILRRRRVRYNLELSPRLDRILQRRAAEGNSSKAEALRFAIDFLEAGYDAKRDGMTVGAWQENEQGQIIRERVFVGL